MIELRDYQVEVVDKLREGTRAGHRRQVLCAPTGAGKTVIAGDLIRKALAKNSRVKFIADRISLVDQTSLRLHEAGIEHGVIQGQNTARTWMPVLVCSAQTLESRGMVSETDMFIIDECHTQRKSIGKMLEAAGKTVIGLTATPFTAGMGKFYTNIVNARTTDDLILSGHLTPLKVFCATEINMDGAATNGLGEWKDSEVASRATPIIGDIVSEWVTQTNHAFGEAVPTLLFTPTIDFGNMMVEQFNQAGYRFAQVSAYGGRENIPKFRRGELDGLVSCEALAKGFDVPDVRCVISARPYKKSLAAHIQQIGRGMRAHPESGKEYCLLLDHGGNYLRFAEATENFWKYGCHELDDGTKKKKKQQAREQRERKCAKCGYVMRVTKDELVCGNCGNTVVRRPPAVNVVSGRLTEYRQGDGREYANDIWPDVCALAVERHPADSEKARKFAMAQYKNLTGLWPEWRRPFTPADHCDAEIRAQVDESIRKFVAGLKRNNWLNKNYRKEEVANEVHG